MRNPRVAIIGAGVSGLAAAWRLRDSPIDVVVVEKSRGVSGRAASRTRNGARIDIGANYFKLESPELEQLVLRELSREGLVEIKDDVWTFDKHGKIYPGDPLQNQQVKWTYSSGISTLGKHLAAAAAADLRLQERVCSLRYLGGHWHLEHEACGRDHREPFDAVLVTAPAPQARDILDRSELEGIDCSVVNEALDRAGYHPQWCFALGFGRALEARPNCFALINSDRCHDIAWLSFENHKPERELGGSTVVMVQMSPQWSARQLEKPAEELFSPVSRAVSSLLGPPEGSVDWYDSQRWRFAHPCSAADESALMACESAGLFFAGDALIGRGRVGEAMTTGLRAADRIVAMLGQPHRPA